MTDIPVFCAHAEMVDIDAVKPHPENPNTHPKAQVEKLSKLIAHLGWRHPIVVSNLSGFVIAGHGRLLAAQRLGVAEVPVDYQDFEDREAEIAMLVADNVIPELAKMADDELSKLLKELDSGEFDVSMIGFSQKEQDRLLADIDDILNEEPPEVEFSLELHESSNYVVLMFTNDIDWLQAMTLFDLKTTKALDSVPGYAKQGIGRVIDGAAAINKLTGA